MPPPEPLIAWQSQIYHNKYVILFDFTNIDYHDSVTELSAILHKLETTGLYTEVRPGFDQTLLIFVQAPRDVLGSAVYKSRVKDWLYSLTSKHPGGAKGSIVDGHFEAENIQSVHHLVHWPKSLGGAEITPGVGECQHVTAIFPLHNKEANQSLLKHLSQRLFLDNNDLDQIRNLFGSKVAFYFAFTQTYTVFLAFPAISGILTWCFLSQYSLTYAILTCTWCTVVLEYWRVREVDLSIRWNVRNVSGVKPNRPQFFWEKAFTDASGQHQYHFPRWKYVSRQFLQIPFVLLSTIALGAIIIVTFTFEVIISEAYRGSYRSLIEFLPTVLLALATPKISTSLESIAATITDFENHRTDDGYEMSLTQKTFMLSIITNYLPIFITAFVYVPLGGDIVPWLSKRIMYRLGSSGDGILGSPQSFTVDSSRLRDEVIALAVTGQVASFLEENIYPVVKRKAQHWYRGWKASRSPNITVTAYMKDDPEEMDFLNAAREQAMLEPYDVQYDIAEIVLQFGYLALFSPVWPLISVGFLFNNIIELRTDFFKIVHEHRRPAPIRSDGIGPWISALDFLTWAGSISTGAIVHLFGSGNIAGGAYWGLPITIFISEHVFMGLRAIVRFALHNIGAEHIRQERNERYAIRSQYLKEIDASSRHGDSLTVAERDRRKSIRASGQDAFFTRQIEEGASAIVAMGLIKACKASLNDTGKSHKE